MFCKNTGFKVVVENFGKLGVFEEIFLGKGAYAHKLTVFLLYAKHGTSDKLSYLNIGNFRKQKRFAGSVIYVYNHFGRSRRQMTGRLFSPRVDIERQGK